jgi:hypothetical protein
MAGHPLNVGKKLYRESRVQLLAEAEPAVAEKIHDFCVKRNTMIRATLKFIAEAEQAEREVAAA